MASRNRLIAVVLAMAILSSSCVWIARVSRYSDGSEIFSDVYVEAVSGNARYVVFRSQGQLDPADTNSYVDLYRKDTRTGALELITISHTGGASDGNASAVELSDDGSLVAFRTAATNMVAGDTNGVDDLYVRDMTAGATTRITLDQFGAQLGESVIAFDVSGDGSTVAWSTTAQVTTPSSGASVYATELATGTIREVSATQAGALRLGGSPSVSYDGQKIAFTSYATDLVGNDTNGVQDVFVKFANGSVFRASTATGGGQSTEPSYSPKISGSALAVAFSTAMDLDPIDTNGIADIYVKTASGTTTLASVADDGSIGSGPYQSHEISHDGTLVSFSTSAPELTGAAASAAIVRDGLNETTTVVSRDENETVAYWGSEPHLSADGNYVAWGANLGVLMPDPDGFAADVFLRWWSSPHIDAISPSTLAVGVSTAVTISGSGFRPNPLVYSHPQGANGIVFSNVTLVDSETITATIDVVLGTATPGAKWVNVQQVGTGPGVLRGAFAQCQCLTITP